MSVFKRGSLKLLGDLFLMISYIEWSHLFNNISCAILVFLLMSAATRHLNIFQCVHTYTRNNTKFATCGANKVLRCLFLNHTLLYFIYSITKRVSSHCVLVLTHCLVWWCVIWDTALVFAALPTHLVAMDTERRQWKLNQNNLAVKSRTLYKYSVSSTLLINIKPVV